METRNPRTPRRKPRRGNKEWSILLVSMLSPQERKALRDFLRRPANRSDLMWWLCMTLQVQTPFRYREELER